MFPLLSFLFSYLYITYSFVSAHENEDKANKIEEEPLELLPLLVSLGAGILMAYFIARDVGPPLHLYESLPKRPTRTIREISMEELHENDGKDGKPIWVAVQGEVFDVTSHTSGRDLYGSNSVYQTFAGKDATVGLAMGTYELSDMNSRTFDDLDSWEIDALEEWKSTFLRKYCIVGQLRNCSGKQKSGSQEVVAALVEQVKSENKSEKLSSVKLSSLDSWKLKQEEAEKKLSQSLQKKMNE
eukprot:g6009.t1